MTYYIINSKISMTQDSFSTLILHIENIHIMDGGIHETVINLVVIHYL